MSVILFRHLCVKHKCRNIKLKLTGMGNTLLIIYIDDIKFLHPFQKSMFLTKCYNTAIVFHIESNLYKKIHRFEIFCTSSFGVYYHETTIWHSQTEFRPQRPYPAPRLFPIIKAVQTPRPSSHRNQITPPITTNISLFLINHYISWNFSHYKGMLIQLGPQILKIELVIKPKWVLLSTWCCRRFFLQWLPSGWRVPRAWQTGPMPTGTSRFGPVGRPCSWTQ